MIIPDGYAQVNTRFEGQPVPSGAEITIGVKLEDGAESPTSLALKWAGQLAASGLVEMFTEDISVRNIHVKFGPNETGGFADQAVVIEGGAPGGSVAPNTSVLVRKQTASGGRAGRGRWYWPGIEEDGVDPGGNVDVSFVTTMGDKLEDLRAGMALEDAPLVVLHGAGSPLSTPSLITAFVVDGKVATQRRRLRR